jgi:hypothetical protein
LRNCYGAGMTIFNKRNALVGFLTLKWLEQRRQRRKKRQALKLAALGVASLGVVAVLGAVLVKRQRGEENRLEGYAYGGDEEIVGEVVTASSEPLPAT